MKYELNTISFNDKLINLFSKYKVKGYCGFCKRSVFNLESKWAKEGLCVFCYEMKKSKVNENDM